MNQGVQSEPLSYVCVCVCGVFIYKTNEFVQLKQTTKYKNLCSLFQLQFLVAFVL